MISGADPECRWRKRDHSHVMIGVTSLRCLRNWRTSTDYFAVNLKAPSRRMFSPFRYGFEMIDSTRIAYSSG